MLAENVSTPSAASPLTSCSLESTVLTTGTSKVPVCTVRTGAYHDGWVSLAGLAELHAAKSNQNTEKVFE
jgi:hypothetical protein